MPRCRYAVLPIALLASTPARAELPDPVRAMIEAAIATGDRAKVEAVVEVAKATNPAEIAAIDAIFADFRAEQQAIAAARREEEQQALQHAGLFEKWSGRGQIGAFQSSGNNDNVGVTAALNFEREGIDWQHRLRATMDYQRSNGRTTREQYFAAYEPRYDISSELFTYALAQYESNRFQGRSSRYAVSGGFGYQVVDTLTMELSVKAGPAWRRTEFTNGTIESSLAALAGFDFEWQFADSVKLTQSTDLVANGGASATAFFDENNTSINLITGLEAELIDWLTARVSYAVEYDSNPPEGAVC